MSDDLERRLSALGRLMTLQARMINLVDKDSQRLATLRRTDDGLTGLALFRPGSDRARAEFMLEATGPTLRLNDEKGKRRLQLHVGADGDPSLVLMDPRGILRVALLTVRGRPHVVIWPRGVRQRRIVAGTPANKLGEDRAIRAAWDRAVRAARANRRARFESAVLDSGFLECDFAKLWTLARRGLQRRPWRTAVA